MIQVQQQQAERAVFALVVADRSSDALAHAAPDLPVQGQGPPLVA